MHASEGEVPEGMVDAMTTNSRAEKAARLERWAEEVSSEELVSVDTDALRHLAALADQRTSIESDLREAVIAARRADRSWSEIGAMLGVSKQAAQRKYGQAASAV